MSRSARKTKRSASTAPKKRPKQPLSSRQSSERQGSDRPEKMSQFTLKMRESLHRELARMAFEANMTMRGFIMNALKSKGLSVTKTDLVDRRRR